MRNNNQEITALLARESYKGNRNRNRVLTAAVALTVMMLFGAFSLAVGKLETDILLYMRNEGTAASTTLERGSQEQQEAIKELPYIKAVGKEVYIGSTQEYICKVLDETGWEKMQAPAYSDIQGEYPQKPEQIMLPLRVLEELGIQKPEIGMEIPVQMTLSGGEKLEKKTFVLSGYYTDYLDLAYRMPAGYFSQEFLEELPVDQEEYTTLLIQQKDNITEETIEELLYRDVKMRDDSQQFSGGVSFYWLSVQDLAGGLAQALLAGGLILFAAAMFLYNVMSISLSRDIRQYGLLKTMGTTKKQLRSIVLRQTAGILARGCILGAAAGTVLTVTVIPSLLSGMYLHGRGDASAMIAFRPLYLFLAVIFGAGVTLVCSLWAVNRVVKMSPIEAVKYTGQKGEDLEKTIGRKKENRKRQIKAFESRRKDLSEKKKKGWDTSGGLTSMAWRNLFRFKRRFFLTLISLSLGIIISLGSVVLSVGMDERNKIDKSQADFSIDCHMNTGVVENYPGDTVFFSPELRNQLISLEGVQEDDTAWGGYGKVKLSEEALQVYVADFESSREDCPVVVQVVQNSWLEELENLKQEKGLYINTESVRQGRGMMVLHYHQLSKIQEEKGKEDLGKSFAVTDLEGKHSARMEFAGYLDFLEKGLDRMATTWNGGGILYFLVSEEGFQKLGLTEQVFRVDLEVEEDLEPLVKTEISHIVSQYNKERGQTGGIEELLNSDALSYNAKSDILAEEEDYIYSSRIVMGALCGLLLLLGIANYFNVTMTSLSMRKRELAVLESLGLTRKQLRKMLVLEGGFTGLLTTLAVVLLGSGLLWAEGAYMSQRIAYFVFHYPLWPLLACIGILFLICVALPLAMYRKTEKQSLVERLSVPE